MTTTHEIRVFIDRGDYGSAFRACRLALSDKSLCDEEVKSEFSKLLNWVEHLKIAKDEEKLSLEEKWIEQSIKFWEGVLKIAPKDQEASTALKFAMSVRHRHFTTRHTKRLIEENREGSEIAS